MFCAITELLRLAGSSEGHLVQSPAQVGSPRAGCQESCPGKFLISPRGGNATAALDNFCHSSVTLIVKQVFPDLHAVPPMYQFVLFASCPITGNHWKELGSMLFTSSLHVFTYINKIPLKPSLFLAEWSYSLRLTLWGRRSSLFIVLVTFYWNLSSIIMTDFFYKRWHMSGSLQCIYYSSRYFKYNRTTSFPIPSFILLCFYQKHLFKWIKKYIFFVYIKRL